MPGIQLLCCTTWPSCTEQVVVSGRNPARAFATSHQHPPAHPSPHRFLTVLTHVSPSPDAPTPAGEPNQDLRTFPYMPYPLLASACPSSLTIVATHWLVNPRHTTFQDRETPSLRSST